MQVMEEAGRALALKIMGSAFQKEGSLKQEFPRSGLPRGVC